MILFAPTYAQGRIWCLCSYSHIPQRVHHQLCAGIGTKGKSQQHANKYFFPCPFCFWMSMMLTVANIPQKNIAPKDLCNYFLKTVGFSTFGNVGIANKRMWVTSPPASFHLLYIGRARASRPPAPADHRQHVIPTGFSWTCDAGHQFALLIRPQVIEPLTTTLKMNQDGAVVITTWLLPIHSIYQALVGPKMQSRPFHEVMPTPWWLHVHSFPHIPGERKSRMRQKKAGASIKAEQLPCVCQPIQYGFYNTANRFSL